MKKMDEFARHLAKLYGIEVIEKPNSHQVTLADGRVLTSEHPHFFAQAFGLPAIVPEPLYRNKSEFTACSPRRTAANHSFHTQKEPIQTVVPDRAGNYNYAMAA